MIDTQLDMANNPHSKSKRDGIVEINLQRKNNQNIVTINGKPSLYPKNPAMSARK